MIKPLIRYPHLFPNFWTPCSLVIPIPCLFFLPLLTLWPRSLLLLANRGRKTCKTKSTLHSLVKPDNELNSPHRLPSPRYQKPTWTNDDNEIPSVLTHRSLRHQYQCSILPFVTKESAPQAKAAFNSWGTLENQSLPKNVKLNPSDDALNRQ